MSSNQTRNPVTNIDQNLSANRKSKLSSRNRTGFWKFSIKYTFLQCFCKFSTVQISSNKTKLVHSLFISTPRRKFHSKLRGRSHIKEHMNTLKYVEIGRAHV